MANPIQPSDGPPDTEVPLQEWLRQLVGAGGTTAPAPDNADEADTPPRYEIVYSESGNYRWREVGSEGTAPAPDNADEADTPPRYEIVYSEGGYYRWREVGSEG